MGSFLGAGQDNYLFIYFLNFVLHIFCCMYIQLTQNKVTLGQTTLSMMDQDDMTLLEVKQASDFTFICPDVQLTESVDTYKGTTSTKAGIISIGDYVKYTDNGAIEAS